MLGMGFDELEMLARRRADDAVRDAERRRLLSRSDGDPARATGAPRRLTVLRWIPRPGR